MVKFLAGLAGVGVLLSNPMLLLGCFLVLIAGVQIFANAIAANSGLTAAITIGSLILLWVAPPAVFVASLVSSEREWQKPAPTSSAEHWKQHNHRWRFPQALLLGVVALVVTSGVFMVLLSFMAGPSCQRGDATPSIAFVSSPLAVIVRSIAPSFGVDTSVTPCS